MGRAIALDTVDFTLKWWRLRIGTIYVVPNRCACYGLLFETPLVFFIRDAALISSQRIFMPVRASC